MQLPFLNILAPTLTLLIEQSD